MQEDWRQIDGIENAYVSDQGRIMVNGRECVPRTDAEGYLRVSVCGKRDRVHRFVARAFIPKPEGRDYVNHKNGNKADNMLLNLEWCTAREISLLAGKAGVLSSDSTKKRVWAYRLADGHGMIFESHADAARFIKCRDCEVNKAVRGKRNTCHGYLLRYV